MYLDFEHKKRAKFVELSFEQRRLFHGKGGPHK
jgi:hypothetical protein